MFKQVVQLIGVALIAAAVAVGCGGSSDGSGSASDAESSPPAVTTSSLSKAAFLKRANAICLRGTKQVEAALAQASKLKGKAAKTAGNAFVGAFVGMSNSVVGEIQKLGAPSGDEEAIEAFLTAMQEAGALASDDSQEDTKATIEVLAKRFQKPDELAGSYGLQRCVF